MSVRNANGIGLGGALHCISRNLPAVGRLPIAAAEEPEAEPAAPVIAEPRPRTRALQPPGL